MEATLHTDGGARPTNPGHAGFSCVLSFGSRKIVTSRYLGRWRTNNYAEMAAVVVGMKMALHEGIVDLVVVTDSKLVQGWVTKDWKCKNFDIKELKKDIEKMAAQFEEFDVQWVKRNKNAEADDYCTRAIHYGMNKNPFTPAAMKKKLRADAAVFESASITSKKRL